MSIVGSLAVLFTGDATSFDAAAKHVNKGLSEFADGVTSVESKMGGMQRVMGGLFSGAVAAGVTGAVKAWLPLEQKIAGLGGLIQDSSVVEEIKGIAQTMSDFANIDESRTLRMAESLKLMGSSKKELGNSLMLVQGMQQASNGMLGDRQAFRMLEAYKQGSSVLFERWIPAMKNARTEEEKSALVREWISRGFDKTSASMNTTAGQMSRASAAAQDIKEEFGKLFTEVLALDVVFGAIGTGLRNLRDWFTQLTPVVRGWVAGLILIVAASGPLIVAFRLLLPLVISLGKSLLAVLLPAVVAVSAAFIGWNLGKTLEQVKVGGSTIGTYMKQLSLSLYEGWTWLWDVMPLKVEAAWNRIKSSIASFKGDEAAAGVYDAAAAQLDAAAKQVMQKRDDAAAANAKWLEEQNKKANETAITSPADFAKRFADNLGSSMNDVVNFGEKIASGSLFKNLLPTTVNPTAPSFNVPGFGAEKNEKKVEGYSAALERGTAAAYSMQVRQQQHLSRIQEASEATAENTSESADLMREMLSMLPQEAAL
jgi:hypothetical protein